MNMMIKAALQGYLCSAAFYIHTGFVNGILGMLFSRILSSPETFFACCLREP